MNSALPSVVKVAIIEDQRPLREGIAWLIAHTEGFRCVGSYYSMEEALRGVKGDTPHIALVDIQLPGMNGIEGISELKRLYPDMLLLMLTVYDDDERIFHALCAGACGYLLKKTPPAKLIESLREAFAGGSPMSPEVARRVVRLFRDFAPPAQADYNLTPHETRVLRLLVEGFNYKTAAVELGVSVNTVAFHMRRIYEKLQVHSKSEAVAKALRERLVK